MERPMLELIFRAAQTGYLVQERLRSIPARQGYWHVRENLSWTGQLDQDLSSSASRWDLGRRVRKTNAWKKVEH